MRAQPPASHFINGSYQEDPHGRPLENRYPATGEVIARLHAAGAETVNAAVAAARSGFRVWAATPAAERGRVLRRAAEILRQRNRELSVNLWENVPAITPS